MELTAIIEALQYVQKDFSSGSIDVEIYSDSQYAIGLLTRRDRLINSNFITKAKKTLPNADLLQDFFKILASFPGLTLTKVKSHQSGSRHEQLNSEVDQVCRRIVREKVSLETSDN